MNIFMLLGGIALLVLAMVGGYTLYQKRQASQQPLAKAQQAQTDALEEVQDAESQALLEQQQAQQAQLEQRQAAVKEAAAQIPPVVEANDATMEHMLSKGTWVVMYYAPWCGHCKTTKPTIQQLGQTLHQARGNGATTAFVAQLDCTKNPEACKKAQVPGYPHIVKFVDGDVVEAYRGDRSLASLQQFSQ